MIDRDDDVPWAEEPNEHGPISNPVDRFIHLPRSTRRWLESLREQDIEAIERFTHLPESSQKWLGQLREEDIADIEEAAEFLHKTKTVGKFGKWLVITFVAIFVGMVQFGEALMKAFAWLLGKGVK